MPNLDATGPEGKGPKTGQSKGRCATDKDTSVTSDRPHRGRSLNKNTNRGRGAGLGLRRNKNA